MTEFCHPPTDPAPDPDGVRHPLLSLEPLEPAAEGGDTWITIGDNPDEVGTEERTVTVVFRRDLFEEAETDDALLRPLSPVFPGTRRR